MTYELGARGLTRFWFGAPRPPVTPPLSIQTDRFSVTVMFMINLYHPSTTWPGRGPPCIWMAAVGGWTPTPYSQRAGMAVRKRGPDHTPTPAPHWHQGPEIADHEAVRRRAPWPAIWRKMPLTRSTGRIRTVNHSSCCRVGAALGQLVRLIT